MPRPALDASAIREEILVACEQLIRERGAVEASVSDIASLCGMSQSNIYRYFENKDALMEAMAGRWFADLETIMEETVSADLPAPQKLFAFFARRLDLLRGRYAEDPDLFASYCELGTQYFEVIRGYVDLADHYLAIIIAQAMDEGYFAGLEIDEALSATNLMVQPFVNPQLMMDMETTATTAKLSLVIHALVTGLNAQGKALGDPSAATSLKLVP